MNINMTAMRSRRMLIAPVVLVLFLTTSSMMARASQDPTSARDTLVQMSQEYGALLATYDPGNPYASVLEQLEQQAAALTEDESDAMGQAFAPILKGMQDDLSLLNEVLAQRSTALGGAIASSDSPAFPSANYPAVDPFNFVIEIVTEDLPNLGDLLTIATQLAAGNTDVSSYVPGDFNGSILPGSCHGDIDGDGIANRTDDDTLLLAQLALQGLEFQHAVADRFCDQDLTVVAVAGLGGNLSLLCIASDIFYLIPKFLLDNILFCESAIDTAEIEGSYKRLGHLHEDVNEVGNSLGNIDSALLNHDTDIKAELTALHLKLDEQDALLERVLANEDRILQLLVTPQGRRPGWNERSSASSTKSRRSRSRSRK